MGFYWYPCQQVIDDFMFGSFMRILIYDLIELTRCWASPSQSVEFTKSFVKLVITKGSVFKSSFH